ncbi:hypothetical protein [Promicromonospora sp. NPDC023987]|uniref:hypothetical protein n=1 Tax=Promicromonospora sp. NPDC023987 TaxID=3155360 RepID=UPI0033C44E5A
MTVAELQERSEEIGQSLTATIDGVDRYQEDMERSLLEWEDAEVNDEDPDGWRYWNWDIAIELAADAELTPEQAAGRMVEVLEEEGWTAGEHSEGDDRAQLGFHRSDELGDGWTVQISFWKKPPPAPQNLSVSVVSPSTNRS